MLDPEKLNRIKKIYRLSKEGIGGERQVAEDLLNRLMAKYNLTIEEVEGEQMFEVEFEYKNEREGRLLINIVASIVGKRVYDFQEYKYKYRRGSCFCGKVTVSEKIDILEALDYYWKEYQKEEKLLIHAFIARHNLYSSEPPEGEKEERKITERDLKILKMAGGLSSEKFDNTKKLN